MLKILAMIIMIIDHLGAILFPEHTWMRIIGRLAFPIFAFFIAEGFAYTKNIKKYIFRMAVFALITEPIFDLAFAGRLTWANQNVMFTFLFAIVGMYFASRQNSVAGYVIIVLAGLLAEICGTDYGCFGVLLVYVYHIMQKEYVKKHISAAVLLVVGAEGIQRYAVLSTLPLILYNGKKGINLKYLFYAFYPAHLLILFVIKYYLI